MNAANEGITRKMFPLDAIHGYKKVVGRNKLVERSETFSTNLLLPEIWLDF